MPSPKSAVDCIGPAFETAIQLMFKPFRWSRWWRIGMLGLATGEAAGSGGCNFNLGDLSKIGESTQRPSQEFLQSAPPWANLPMAQIAALLTLAIVLLLLLVVVHMYVGSVLRFVLFDAVARDRCHLREGWTRWHGQGLRYFGFQWLVLFISLVGYGILIGVPMLAAVGLGVFRDSKEHWGLIALGVLVLLPVVLLFAVAMAVAMVLFKDFGVPIMALEQTGAIEAWRRVWAMTKAAKGSFAGYIGMKILLAIAAAIAIGIVQLIIFFIPLIALVAVGVGVYAAVPELIKSPAGIAMLVTGVVTVVFVLMLVGAIIASPAVVFFQAYVLTFFASRYERLREYMAPSAAAPATEVIPEPPPLPAM